MSRARILLLRAGVSTALVVAALLLGGCAFETDVERRDDGLCVEHSTERIFWVVPIITDDDVIECPTTSPE